MSRRLRTAGWWVRLGFWLGLCALAGAGSPVDAGLKRNGGGPQLRGLVVDISPGVTRVWISSSEAVQPTWRRLRRPERVVLDLPRLTYARVPEELFVAAGGIRRVRVLAWDSHGIRVEVELERRWEVRLAEADHNREVTLEFATGELATSGAIARADERSERPAATREDPARPAPAARQSANRPEPAVLPPAPGPSPAPRLEPPDASPAPPARVTRVEIQRNNSELEILVRTSRGTRVSGRTLDDGQPRYYIDLENTSLAGVELPDLTSGPGLLRLRAGEHAGETPTARIVADLAPGAVAQLDADEDAGRYRIRIIPPAVRPPSPRQLGVVVALDAGHGGEDTGAPGPTGLTEKAVCLDIVLRLQKLLEAAGFEVVLSRDRDFTIDPYDRAAWCRSIRADLLVSVHCDSIEDRPEVTGTTTYFREEWRTSSQLAACVQKCLVEAIDLPDRGVRLDTDLHPGKGLYILRNFPRPGVLVETGFISHRDTERRFRDPAFRDQIARGIAAGVRQYVLAGGLREARR